MVRFFD